jgi:hypothetical protein
MAADLLVLIIAAIGFFWAGDGAAGSALLLGIRALRGLAARPGSRTTPRAFAPLLLIMSATGFGVADG